MTGQRPLEGLRVVVTRGPSQASALSEALAAEGATPVEFATLTIGAAADGGASLGAAVEGADRFEWVVLTSANGVEAYLAARSAADRAGHQPRHAAVGERTRQALERGGIVADFVPSSFRADALVAEFESGSGRVLYPAGSLAGPNISDGLAAKGWTVERVEAYQTVPVDPAPEAIEAVRSAQVVTFASSSSVARFAQMVDPADIPETVICIGPATAATAGEVGIRVDRVADPHTIEGLVAAVVAESNDRAEHPNPSSE